MSGQSWPGCQVTTDPYSGCQMPDPFSRASSTNIWVILTQIPDHLDPAMGQASMDSEFGSTLNRKYFQSVWWILYLPIAHYLTVYCQTPCIHNAICSVKSQFKTMDQTFFRVLFLLGQVLTLLLLYRKATLHTNKSKNQINNQMYCKLACFIV